MRNPWASKHSKEEIDAAVSQFKQRVAEYERLGDRHTGEKPGYSKVGWLLFLIVLIILGVVVVRGHTALVIVGLFVSAPKSLVDRYH
jgi:hypothetical protein